MEGGRRWPALAVHLTVTVAAYLGALLYALSLGVLVEMYGLIWPPAGVAVASLLLAPRRWWPALLAALFVTQVGFDLVRYDAPLIPAVLWASANLTSHLVVSALVVRWGAAALDTVRRVVRFSLAVLLGSAPAGLLGALGAVLSGDPTPYLVTVALWITGAVVGIMMVVPLVLLAAGQVPRSSRTPAEFVLIMGVVLVGAVAVFGPRNHLLAATLQSSLLLPVVWGALRLRLAGAAVAITLTANIALIGTTFGRGPFAGPDWTPIGSAALLRVFIVVLAVAALLIASRAQEGVSSAGLAAEREQLLAAVSHELRTPLTPIVGLSQLLLRARPELDPQAREWIEAIDRNGQHLTALIDDLLLLGRANRGRVVTEPGEVGLAELVAQVVGDLRDPRVRVGAVEQEVRAWADRRQVRQILDNLVHNGLRHGAPPVVVEVAEVQGQARLVVTDAGPGVPDELTTRLFEPFAQPAVGDLRPTQGLGLGLAICAELADGNGGAIAHEPAPGGGARFVVHLPLAHPTPVPAGASDVVGGRVAS